MSYMALLWHRWRTGGSHMPVSRHGKCEEGGMGLTWYVCGRCVRLFWIRPWPHHMEDVYVHMAAFLHLPMMAGNT